MSFSPLINQFVESLQCLPGVGPKSAQRMVMHLLDKNREHGKQLANNMLEAIDKVGHCDLCRTFSEMPICDVCSNKHRDESTLCIVETPMDMMAIESTGAYHGLYFVLLGRISPLDGIGPDDLQLSDLDRRLKSDQVQEVILAVNPTVEGEATAAYITKMIRQAGKKISRIAYGVPFGGELEFVDSNTLQHAFGQRQMVE